VYFIIDIGYNRYIRCSTLCSRTGKQQLLCVEEGPVAPQCSIASLCV